MSDNTHYFTALTVAGSDSSGGAGIQADIKTMSAIGVYGMSAITAVTVQNTMGVSAIQGIDPAIVKGQIDAVFDDIRPLAVKTGMLFSAPIVNAVADSFACNRAVNIVVDPVMVATSGSKLIDDNAIDAVVRRLFAMATIITPNVAEARVLTGCSRQADQISVLRRLGTRNLLLKGGDSGGDSSIDLFVAEGSDEPVELRAARVDTVNTHGTGCTLSSAIASYLALGYPLLRSVELAKIYLTDALISGSHVTIGKGHGPVNHFWHQSVLMTYKTSQQL